MTASATIINEKEVKLSNLEKVFWPEGLTKAHLIDYYARIGPILLPHLKNRPFVMVRYPDGIDGKFFYQKEKPDYTPAWINSYKVSHSEEDKNYIICNDLETLIWLANQACIEMHPWLAQINDLDCPDLAVFDLDPAPPADFKDTLEIALLIKEALGEFGLKGYPKTSGATGMHIYIPLKPELTYPQVKECIHYLCSFINQVYPQKTTLERVVEKRTGKVYLDYLQNGKGRTMACHYSLRPHPGAPVSTPLLWKEIAKKQVDPAAYNINTIFRRVQEYGDLFEGLLTEKQSFKNVWKLISKL